MFFLKMCPWILIDIRGYQEVNEKRFHLLLYSIELRTFSLSIL